MAWTAGVSIADRWSFHIWTGTGGQENGQRSCCPALGLANARMWLPDGCLALGGVGAFITQGRLSFVDYPDCVVHVVAVV
jgi:hypothetical protein